ncbi:hypothetical protein, partial [Pectobacterium brasiliense]|uniref:hypothetical protein n=1 Tax=Pectobacterium brasiliense TaxID=180957 RepID=UPI001969795F
GAIPPRRKITSTARSQENKSGVARKRFTLLFRYSRFNSAHRFVISLNVSVSSRFYFLQTSKNAYERQRLFGLF